MSDPPVEHLLSPALLEAWQDYSAACQTMFEHFDGVSPLPADSPMPFEFFAPWKDFAEKLGMRSEFPCGEPCKPQGFGSLFPALGLTRESQEIGRRMLELAGRFQQRYAEFAHYGSDIAKSALQSFQKRTASAEPMQKAPTALYDAWIDCAEEAYAGAAHTENFAKLLADICNILSAFKLERGKLLEALARQLDWPSRAEVDSLHRRVMALTESAKAGKSRKTLTPEARKPKASKPKASQPKALGSKAHRPPKRIRS